MGLSRFRIGKFDSCLQFGPAPERDCTSHMEALLPEENPQDLLDADRLCVGGRRFTPDEVVSTLSPHLSQDRLARIKEVVSRRTRSLAVVVEGIVNAGNVSAVMRSAEAMGLLSFHVILGDVRYKTSKRTTQGAEKWLDVYRWESPDACADHLQRHGYRLIATHLDAASPITSFDFARGRTAIVFGNEREGLSEAMLRRCDARMVIPIAGFAQSFNISVAAAIGLYHAQLVRSATAGGFGDLTEEERAVLTADYVIRSVGAAEAILGTR